MNANTTRVEGAARAKILAALAVLAVVACALVAIAPTSEGAEPATPTEVSDATGLTNAVSGESETFNVKLTKDITLTSALVVSKAGTIDLNGYEITNANNQHTIVVKTGGDLTITDSSTTKNGTVDNTSNTKGALVIEANGTATLNGGTFERSKETGIDKDTSGGNSYYTILNKGTLTLDGATVKNNGSFSSAICNAGTSNAKAQMTVEDGTTVTGGLNAVKNDEYGVMTINGGTFTNIDLANSQTAIQNWNDLTINGGNFNGKMFSVANGTWKSNSADAMSGIGKLTINGGTFSNSGNNAAVYMTSFDYSKSAKVTLGNIYIDENVNGVEVFVANGCDATGSVAFGQNSVTLSGIKAGTDGITFSKGSVEITGTMTASDAQAEIDAAEGDVILKDLTITSGTLSITGDVETRGEVTINSDATVNVADGASITVSRGSTFTNNGTTSVGAGAKFVSEGNVINNSKIEGSGSVSGNVTNGQNGTMTGVDTSEVVNSGTIEDQTVAGTATENHTYPENQRVIVAANTTWTISEGCVVVIQGQFVVEGTVVVEAGGKLVIGDVTKAPAVATVDGEIENIGDVIVANGKMAVNGSIVAVEGNVVVSNGELTVNGTLDIQSDAAVSTVSGKIVVASAGTMNVYGSVGTEAITIPAINQTINQSTKLVVDNSGTVVLNNSSAYRGESTPAVVIAGEMTVNMVSSGATVDLQSYLLETTGAKLTITDAGATIGAGNNKFTVTDGNKIEFGLTSGQTAATVISGTASIVSTATGNATNGYTYTLAVSGDLSAAYADSTADSADCSVDVTLTGAVDSAANVTPKITAGIVVSDVLDIGTGIALKNAGQLDVSGQIYITADNNKGLTNTSGTVNIVGEDGLVRILKNDITTDGYVNAAYYQTQEGETRATYNNYASFSGAVAGVTAESNLRASKNVTIFGEVTVSQNVDVPSPVSVSFNEATDKLYIGSTTAEGRNVVVTIADGAKVSATGSEQVIVDGTLTYANKRNDAAANATVSDVTVEDKESRTGSRTYTNIYTALANADDNETVTVSKTSGFVDIAQNITVRATVTLDVPAGTAPLLLRDGVTMTVEGTLTSGMEIYAESSFGLTASAVEGSEASAIVVTGTIESDVGLSYGESTANADLAGITGNVAALSAGAPIAGAYYSTTECEYVISAIGIALTAENVADIITPITVNGSVTAGDLTFTAGDDCTEIIVAKNNLANIPDVLTVDNLTLTESKLTVNGVFNGTVNVNDASLEVSSVTGFTVSDAEGMNVDVAGTAKADEETDSVFELTSGTAVFTGTADATEDLIVEVVVASGATLVSNGANINTLTVNGTLDIAPGVTGNVRSITSANLVINENGTMTVETGETAEITNLTVYGTFTVAVASTTSAAGSATVDNLYIGFTPKDAEKGNAAADGTVAGPVTYSGLAYVSPNATVDESLRTVFDSKTETQFMADGSLWFTIYSAQNTALTLPADVPVDNVKLEKWIDADEKEYEPAATDYSAAKDNVLTAEIKTDIYTVYVLANAAVDDVFIDGQIMQYGIIPSLDGSNNGAFYGYYATVAAGTHQISYTLANGYSGNGVLAVNGTTASGMTFVVNDENGMNYNLQLTGFEKSGYTPSQPDTNGNDGLGITDYLLIILVVLIVVMAIIVAMRLMRS